SHPCLRLWRFALAMLVLAAAGFAHAEPAPVQTITSALASPSNADQFPVDAPGGTVQLPDDWDDSRPQFEGSVWYRARFDMAESGDPNELLALYVERVCTNLEVRLNGHLIFNGGRMAEPVTRNCMYPQLVTLPTALLRERGNVLDIQVVGHALQRVTSRQRAAGLSALKIGPQSVLAAEYARRLFWNVTAVQIASLALVVLGCVMVALSWMQRREAYLGYFGWLALAWAVMSLRLWWRDMPWDNGVIEFLFCTGFAPVTALAVQYLLSYSQLRSRWIEAALAVQWVLMPLTLLLAGPGRLFTMASVWYVLLMLEVLAAAVLHLYVIWRRSRPEFWPMAVLLAGAVAMVLTELAIQHDLVVLPRMQWLHFAVPLLFIGIAGRLMQVFVRSLLAAEAGRSTLEGRVKEITAEIEQNFAQLAEMRVEQVTEKERKRIAADLHDDLGAKLLTIVHTSEDPRISSLAREALEEMRLSVRGLTGKAVRLDDALGDWRAELMARLAQSGIRGEWSSPEEMTQTLSARTYVQTTRILREATSNVIKHSGAAQCTFTCAIADDDLLLSIQDNGDGIPMELDGRLDRGHGMATMKHRAKQMQGQCLVESGPGYGTVIRLTLPLDQATLPPP
ncbi:MAG: ATP-binding protein, partial [Rubrivivax sp.]